MGVGLGPGPGFGSHTSLGGQNSMDKSTAAPGPSLQDLPADRGEKQYAQAQNIKSILSLCSQPRHGRSGSQMRGEVVLSSRFNIVRRRIL